MSAPFSRTLRALRSDGSRTWPRLLLLGFVLIGAWSAWFLIARVGLYETSSTGRLEARAAPHRIAPTVRGRVREVIATVGQTVRRGQVLFVLDREAQALELGAGRARSKALEARIDALVQTIAQHRSALSALGEQSVTAAAEADAWRREAQARAANAEASAHITQELVSVNASSPDALRQSRATADALQAEATARQIAISGVERRRKLETWDRRAEIAELEQQIVTFRGELQVQDAQNARLAYAFAERAIRAPIDGIVAELSDIQVGSFVEEGEKLGTVVPAGKAQAVAWFDVTAAGRIRAGQPATLRFPGFPSTQYGTVGATVSKVSREPVNGRFRILLELAENTHRIPIAHGVPLNAEVRVEQLTPARLVLRMVGKWLL